MTEYRELHSVLVEDRIFGLMGVGAEVDNCGASGHDWVSGEHGLCGDETVVDSTYLNADEQPKGARVEPDARARGMYDVASLAIVQILLGMDNLVEAERRLGPVSDVLDDHPDARLSFPVEAALYSDYLRNSQPLLYKRICKAQRSLTESPNDVEGIDCVVAIPVAGHQEYGGMYRTLRSYTRQSIGVGKFEILLNVNMPADLRLAGYSPDSADMECFGQTLSEVERFRRDYPDVVVRYFTTMYRGDQSPIGRIRSDLWAVINEDLVERGRREDILVISNDTDTVSMDPDYLAVMTKQFRETRADIVTAKLRWEPVPGLRSDAMANRYLRFHTFLDSVLRNNANCLHTSDANTGISMAMYTAVGGFDRRRGIGEMVELADRVRCYRDFESIPVGSARKVEVGANAWLRTDSRRVIRAFSLGLDLHHAWGHESLPFGASDDLRTECTDPLSVERAVARSWLEWYMNGAEYYMRHVDDRKYMRLLKGALRVQGLGDVAVAGRGGFEVVDVEDDVIAGWDLTDVERIPIREVTL